MVLDTLIGSIYEDKGWNQIWCHELMNSSKTLTVPEAGRIYFDLSRNASYEAAKRGDLPTIRVGRLLRVPVIALERMLERAGAGKAA
jgi:hypothetical protein